MSEVTKNGRWGERSGFVDSVMGVLCERTGVAGGGGMRVGGVTNCGGLVGACLFPGWCSNYLALFYWPVTPRMVGCYPSRFFVV